MISSFKEAPVEFVIQLVLSSDCLKQMQVNIAANETIIFHEISPTV